MTVPRIFTWLNRYYDSSSRYFIPAVVIFSILTFIVEEFIGEAMAYYMSRALAIVLFLYLFCWAILSFFPFKDKSHKKDINN